LPANVAVGSLAGRVAALEAEVTRLRHEIDALKNRS